MQPNKSDVLSFLRSVSIMSVAVNGARGPISAILLFAVDDDFTIYFATHRDSYKAQALLLDPRISLSVWEQHRVLVQLDAVAQEIVDPQEVEATLDKLVASVARVGNFWPPVLRFEGDGYIAFRLKPNWVRVLDLTSDTILSHENPFVELSI